MAAEVAGQRRSRDRPRPRANECRNRQPVETGAVAAEAGRPRHPRPRRARHHPPRWAQRGRATMAAGCAVAEAAAERPPLPPRLRPAPAHPRPAPGSARADEAGPFRTSARRPRADLAIDAAVAAAPRPVRSRPRRCHRCCRWSPPDAEVERRRTCLTRQKARRERSVYLSLDSCRLGRPYAWRARPDELAPDLPRAARAPPRLLLLPRARALARDRLP